MKSLPDQRQRMFSAAITKQGYVTVFPDAQPAIDTLCDVIRCLHAGLLARGATKQDIGDLLSRPSDTLSSTGGEGRGEEAFTFLNSPQPSTH